MKASGQVVGVNKAHVGIVSRDSKSVRVFLGGSWPHPPQIWSSWYVSKRRSSSRRLALTPAMLKQMVAPRLAFSRGVMNVNTLVRISSVKKYSKLQRERQSAPQLHDTFTPNSWIIELAMRTFRASTSGLDARKRCTLSTGCKVLTLNDR